jgi:uncharacterized protein YbjT (DUF2867 family)
VVRELRERGAEVRAFVRDRNRARERLGDGIEFAVGDFADVDSLRGALHGAQDMVLSCADDARRVEWEANAIDAAAAAGVRRIVKLSTIAAAPGAPVAFWDWHGRVEEHLRASGVAAVILQSSFYMSNLLAEARQVAAEGYICAPVDGAPIAMIDPRDVGAAAAGVLATAGHDGRTYVLTGPEAITYERVAADLSAATGREVRFVDVSDDVARRGILEAGIPDFVAEQLVLVYRQLRQGVAERVTDTVEALTGRPPRSFAAFARENASLFEPNRPAVAAQRS